MVAPFEEAAFALSESGDVTPELVETQFGYHIIRLMERKQDDTMTPEIAKQQLHAQLKRDAERELEDALLKKAEVRANPAIIPDDLLQ